MVSIENKPIGVARGKFNAPFRTIQVEQGDSGDVLKDLVTQGQFADQPWVTWLDYDGTFDETMLDDLQVVVADAPSNSVVLVTFNATANSLGDSPAKRDKYLRKLMGTAVSDQLSIGDFGKDRISQTIIASMQAYVASLAAKLGRLGGYLPAWSIAYRDGAPMVTIGGILPTEATRPGLQQILASKDWIGIQPNEVAAPPLTLKEISALQRLLPSGQPLTRANVQALGFDLEDAQIAAYSDHYKRYPAFVQVIT